MNQEKWNKYLKAGGPYSGDCAPDDTPPAIEKWEIKGKILDIGCGKGGWTHMLKNKGEVIGLDIQPKENDYGFIPVKGDMHELPFADKTFDGVFCGNSFEHALAPYIVMCEINRVLKVGGELLIIIPEANERWVKDGWHISVLNEVQIDSLCDKTNFEKIEAYDGKYMLIYKVKKVKDVGL